MWERVKVLFLRDMRLRVTGRVCVGVCVLKRACESVVLKSACESAWRCVGVHERARGSA